MICLIKSFIQTHTYQHAIFYLQCNTIIFSMYNSMLSILNILYLYTLMLTVGRNLKRRIPSSSNSCCKNPFFFFFVNIQLFSTGQGIHFLQGNITRKISKTCFIHSIIEFLIIFKFPYHVWDAKICTFWERGWWNISCLIK